MDRVEQTRVVARMEETRSEEEAAPTSASMTMEAWAALRGESPCAPGMPPDECARTRLIGELSRILREPAMPEGTRTAGLTLIGWLARRMPGEAAHALGAPGAEAASEPAAETDAAPRSARGVSASPASATRASQPSGARREDRRGKR
jgi:hypothetical protein